MTNRLGANWVRVWIVVLLSGTAAARGEISHSPLGPRASENVDLVAKFRDPRGIEEVYIEIWKGPLQLALASAGIPSGLPSWKELPKLEVQVCRFSKGPAAAECAYRMKRPHTEATLVSYSAWFVARGEGGYKDKARKRTIQDTVAFAIGDPGASNLPGMAWPLVWNLKAPLAVRVDLGFTYPPALFQPVERIREIRRLVLEGSSAYADQLASMMPLYNLWLLTPVADYDRSLPCKFKLPQTANAPVSFMDGMVLVHEEPTVDCGYLSLGYGGSGLGGLGSVRTRWSASRPQLDSPSGLTLSHEMGHFLFEQSDEYEKRGAYAPAASCPNVRESKGECEYDLKDFKVPSPPAGCEFFVGNGATIDLWRSRAGGTPVREVMEVGPFGAVPNRIEWGATSSQCLDRRLEEISGERLDEAPLPATGSPTVGTAEVANLRELRVAVGPDLDVEPKIPQGKKGVIVALQTCNRGNTIWMARIPPETERTVGGRGPDPCVSQPLATGCEQEDPPPGATLDRTWIAGGVKVGAREVTGEDCWRVYARKGVDRKRVQVSQAGPCWPRLAVEGRGLFERQVGLKIVVALEADDDVVDYCLARKPSPDPQQKEPPVFLSLQ